MKVVTTIKSLGDKDLGNLSPGEGIKGVQKILSSGRGAEAEALEIEQSDRAEVQNKGTGAGVQT